LGPGIGYAPFFEDEVGNDFGGPTVGQVSGGLGTLTENRLEFGFLCGVEFDGSAGLRFTSEACKAFALDGRSPTFDGGERGFRDSDDFVVSEATQNQFTGLKAATCLRGKGCDCCFHKNIYAKSRHLFRNF